MKYIVEEDLSRFKFWGGAADNVALLTHDELDMIDRELSSMFHDDKPPSNVDINDMFWFDFDSVVELIGLHLNDDDEIIRD